MVGQVVIKKPNTFDPSTLLAENKKLLSNIKFPSASFQIKYAVTRGADKGWAPPETHDSVSYLFLNMGRQVRFV